MAERLGNALFWISIIAAVALIWDSFTVVDSDPITTFKWAGIFVLIGGTCKYGLGGK